MSHPILHLLNQSPTSSLCLSQCLERCSEGDAIMLFGDGVYSAFDDSLTAALGHYKVYVLGDDIKARGLAEQALAESIETVGYEQFVQLTIDYTLSLSWY